VTVAKGWYFRLDPTWEGNTCQFVESKQVEAIVAGRLQPAAGRENDLSHDGIKSKAQDEGIESWNKERMSVLARGLRLQNQTARELVVTERRRVSKPACRGSLPKNRTIPRNVNQSSGDVYLRTAVNGELRKSERNEKINCIAL
jgi:hypothetical protein